MRRLTPLLFGLAGLLLWISPAAAEEFTFQFQEIRDVPEPLQFKLSLVNGSATITGTNDDRLIVSAVKKIHAANASEAQRVAAHIEIRVDSTADGFEVNTNYLPMAGGDPSFWDKLFGGSNDAYGAVDYLITLPTFSSVTVAIKHGDIEVSSVEGDVDIHSESGKTVGEYIFGPVTVVQQAGDIDLQWIEGDIRVRSVTGRTSIRQLQGALDVTTESGNVSIQTELDSPKDYFVETGSGKITFTIPEESSGTLQIETEAGEVQMDLPVTVTSASRRGIVGEFGYGGPRITLTSSTGEVTVAQF